MDVKGKVLLQLFNKES